MSERSSAAATRARRDVLPLSLPPRGLDRVEAARYIGVSVGKFDEMVADGRMPRPKRIDARKVWDRLALDVAFYALPDDGEGAANPWDQPAEDPWIAGADAYQEPGRRRKVKA